MKLKTVYFLLAIVGCFCGSTLAQTDFDTTGFDIKPQSVSGGLIFTGAHDDASQDEITNVQTYGYYFNNVDNPYFDQDPGVNAASGSGLQSVGAAPGFAGPILSFSILSSVTYWDGTGPVTQLPMPGDASLVYNLGASSRVLDGSSGAQSGFNLGTVNVSNGTFHKHLNAYLFGNHGTGGNPIPDDPIPAPAGIYFVTLMFTDTGGNGTASTKPLYLVYDNGLSSDAEDQARLYIRNVYTPLTNLPRLSVAATDTTAAMNYPSTWNIDADGSWTNPAAWNGPVPASAAEDAVLGQTISGNVTVNLPTPQTVGHIAFDNSHSYTLTGSTLALGDGSAPAEIAVNSGSHTIAAPLYLASQTTFAVVNAGSTLTISSPITAASGVRVAKEGLGKVAAPALAAAGLDVVQGTYQLAASSQTSPSQLGELTVRCGATLDLISGSIIVTYSGASPAASLTALIASAYDDGMWDQPGLTSSTAAGQSLTGIGLIDNADAHLAQFENISVPTSAVLLKCTWYGDANLDGVVNADDFALLDRGFAKQLSGWMNGDFNYDGIINQQDYLLIDRIFVMSGGGSLSPGFLSLREAEFGDAYVAQLIASVPEPSLIGLALIAFIGRRIRRPSSNSI